MLFGIAGSIGIGVFSFFYEKEGWANFFIAGRHGTTTKAYLTEACGRFGHQTVIRPEADGIGGSDLRKTCKSMVFALLGDAQLRPKALPAFMSGSGYHIITVYGMDDDPARPMIGDGRRRAFACVTG